MELELRITTDIKEETIQKTNWTIFTELIKSTTSHINILKTKQDIIREINIVNEEIRKAIYQSTKTYKFSKEKPYLLPPEVRQLIKDKRKARKLAQRTLNPRDAAEATRLNNIIRRWLQEIKHEHWENKMEDYNNDFGKIYQKIKKWRKGQPKMPPMRGPRGIVYTNTEKAEIMADSLEKQFFPNPPDSDSEEEDEESTVETNNTSSETPHKVTTQPPKKNLIMNP